MDLTKEQQEAILEVVLRAKKLHDNDNLNSAQVEIVYPDGETDVFTILVNLYAKDNPDYDFEVIDTGVFTEEEAQEIAQGTLELLDKFICMEEALSNDIIKNK